MSINGLGSLLNAYECRLLESGVPKETVAEMRGYVIAECASKLPIVHAQKRALIASAALKLRDHK